MNLNFKSSTVNMVDTNKAQILNMEIKIYKYAYFKNMNSLG